MLLSDPDTGAPGGGNSNSHGFQDKKENQNADALILDVRCNDSATVAFEYGSICQI